MQFIALLTSASTAAVATGAQAQQVNQSQALAKSADQTANGQVQPAPQAAPAPAKAADQGQAIVITGSLIANTNYRAPTPVTVVTGGDLLKASPSSVAVGVQQLPQFGGSTSYSNYAQVQQVRGEYLNLRDIGAIRTLAMVDGIRIPANTYNGQTDVSVIPNLLVKRVDVVTAGASAAYGSDAVAGVVNFILDDNFTGVKGEFQGGMSTYADYLNYRVGLAAGFQPIKGLHLLFSYERDQNSELQNQDRPFNAGIWASAGAHVGAGVAGTAANPLVLTENTTFGRAASALITSPGALANIYFPTVGTYRPVNFGGLTGSPGIFTTPSDFVAFDQSLTMVAPSQNDHAFGRISYDVTDNINAFVMATVSVPRYKQSLTNYAITGSSIFSGNPYIPAGLQQIMTAQNIPFFKFNMGIHGGFPLNYETYKGKDYTIYSGIKGSIFDKFSWSVNYTHARSQLDVAYPTINNRQLAAALDAVRDPATGNIVCNVSLTNPGLYPGCVPLNPMGIGAISQAAYNYILGDSTWRSVNLADMVSGKISGELFNAWAGPVSAAVGAEYRHESLDLTSNAPPTLTPPITGLRGIAPTTPVFYNLDQGLAQGKINVKEAFGELQVPILKDSPVGKSLDLNGAIRYTDYSTSGGVVTWKAGGTYKPVDGLTFRLTRSRDIRAPNLYELYAGIQGAITGITDPHTNQAFSVETFTGGNPNLKPEIGNTFTAGVVLQPEMLRGFSMSVDYYNIKIRDAIGTLTAQAILNTCEASGGTDPSCALVVRPLPFSDRTPANVPTLINVVPANLAVMKLSGFDVEATYHTPVWQGVLTSHLLLTYLSDFETQSASNQPFFKQAGFGSPTNAFAGPLVGGLPRLKATLNLDYEKGDFGLFLQERMIGSMTIGNATTVYAYPKIPAVFYTNLTATARPSGLRRWGGEVFFTVTNLFNKEPPIIASVNGGLPFPATDPTLYDVIGRTYTLGLRFKL
ncbi:MAG TPA: TonB-dependent receptor [Sphingomicrobium sp.]|nr:TonB-dependent receptor [Sphingomicrobium sp.]